MAEKTRLEILTTWGTLTVAGLWAVVGFYYTTQKDAFDRETRKYSIVTDLMKKCTSSDAAVKVETQRIMGFYLNGSMGTEATKEIFGGPDEFKKLSSACNTWISNLSNQPLALAASSR